jgi:outer membrane protein
MSAQVNRLKKAVLAVLVAASLASAARAETRRLSLDDAIRTALSEGTQARLAASQEQRAEIARREALSGLLPQSEARLMRYSESINLETFGFSIPGQPAVVGPFNVVDGQITAAVQLFNLAALRYYQATKAGVTAGRARFEQAQNDVASAVARMYVLVQRADAQAVSRQADVNLFEQLARVANDEFQAGTGTRLDVAQANVQLSRARQALLAAQNDRETARLALLNAIGADQTAELILAQPLDTPPTPPAADAALATAKLRRPELREAEANEQQASLALAAARDRRIPRVEFNFQGDLSGTHVDDLKSTRRIGGAIAVPIFRGDIEANVARARLELEDVRTRSNSLRSDVEQQVRTSLLTLQNAEARVTVATETATVAEEALTIARDRRAAGYGSSVEVDRAEDAFRQAHEDVIAARADATLAWYQLQHATGTISDRYRETK